MPLQARGRVTRKQKGAESALTPGGGLREALLQEDDLSKDAGEAGFEFRDSPSQNPDRPAASLCTDAPPCRTPVGYCPPAFIPGEGSEESAPRNPVAGYGVTAVTPIMEVLARVPKHTQGIVAIPGSERGVEAVGEILGEDVSTALAAAGFCSLLDLLPAGGREGFAVPGGDSPGAKEERGRAASFALAGSCGDRRAGVTYAQLRTMLARDVLAELGLSRGARVGVEVWGEVDAESARRHSPEPRTSLRAPRCL